MVAAAGAVHEKALAAAKFTLADEVPKQLTHPLTTELTDNGAYPG